MDKPAPKGPPSGYELFPFVREAQLAASQMFTAEGFKSLREFAAWFEGYKYAPQEAARLAQEYTQRYFQAASAMRQGGATAIDREVYQTWPGKLNHNYMIDLRVEEYDPKTGKTINVIPWSVVSSKPLDAAGWQQAIEQALAEAAVAGPGSDSWRYVRAPQVVGLWRSGEVE